MLRLPPMSPRTATLFPDTPLFRSGRAVTAAGPGNPQSGDAASGSLVLDQFGRNLTQQAREKKLDPVIGRAKEIERVMQVLSRRQKNNPVLVGEHGVGKTAVVEIGRAHG